MESSKREKGHNQGDVEHGPSRSVHFRFRGKEIKMKTWGSGPGQRDFNSGRKESLYLFVAMARGSIELTSFLYTEPSLVR